MEPRMDGEEAYREEQGTLYISAVCSRVAYSDQERPSRSYLLPAGEGAPQGRMRDEMLALARKFPSSGRSGPTPQAGFPPLPGGEGAEALPRLQLNGKTRYDVPPCVFAALTSSLMTLNSGRSAVSSHSKRTASVVERIAPACSILRRAN